MLLFGCSWWHLMIVVFFCCFRCHDKQGVNWLKSSPPHSGELLLVRNKTAKFSSEILKRFKINGGNHASYKHSVPVGGGSLYLYPPPPHTHIIYNILNVSPIQLNDSSVHITWWQMSPFLTFWYKTITWLRMKRPHCIGQKHTWSEVAPFLNEKVPFFELQIAQQKVPQFASCAKTTLLCVSEKDVFDQRDFGSITRCVLLAVVLWSFWQTCFIELYKRPALPS